MKVWIDVLTPKQANFFAELQHRLSVKGLKTIITTREYREVNEVLDLRKVKSIQVGRHGGGSLNDKLVESAKRVSALIQVVEEQEPDVAISFSSPEAARVAFGLKIPHYCVSDSPHAEAVCKLTIPLSRKLFTPWVIPTYAWSKYGIAPKDVLKYRALDPIVWLNTNRNCNNRVLDDLKLDVTKPIIMVRPPEELAAYLAARSSTISATTIDIIAKILDHEQDGFQVLVLSRYDGQSEKLKKRFGNSVTAPEHVVDTVPLLRAASVFIGGGGTMTAEAALLGVPAVSYYPGEPTFVDRFLMNQGLMDRLQDPGRIAQRTIAISKNNDFRELCRKKSGKLLQSMEDPLKTIIQKVFK
jgi:uncharacterized protein